MGNYLFTLAIILSSIIKCEEVWQSHSAYMMQAKRWEIGIFQPFRHAYSSSFEYSVHPLLFFVIPNISFKIKMKDFKSFKIANRTSLLYPTPILNMVSRKGIGGLIDPNITMPPMLGVSTSLIMSKELLNMDFTSKMGIDIGLIFGNLDDRSNIDLPIIYHRLEVFHNKWGINGGLDIIKKITNNFQVLFDLDLRFLPDIEKGKSEENFSMRSGDYSIEHKMLFIWNHSNRFRVILGYKLVNGDYPHGRETRILPYVPMLESWVPIVELQWAK